MAHFIYKARDQQGLAIQGVVEAESELKLAENLQHLGYRVIHIEERKGKSPFELRFSGRRKVSSQELILFTRQLATMLKSGLPIAEALKTILHQTEHRFFFLSIEKIIKDIEGGLPFSEALSRHSKIFPPLFVSMIEVGEAAGILDQVLERLVLLYTQEFELRMRLRSAMIYPVILVTAAIAIISFFLISIIPKFVVVFEAYNARLPLATTLLLGLSNLLSHIWFILILGLIAVIFVIKNYSRTEKGRYQIHQFLLKVPVFGPFYLKTIVARFTRILSMLIQSGVPLLEALSVTEKTINNVVISQVVGHVRLAVSSGQPLSEPFKTSAVFPPMVVQMISAGEKSGRIDVMLMDVASYYDQEIEYLLKNIPAILEPVLLLVMGGTVLFIALAVLLPIFNLIKVFRSM